MFGAGSCHSKCVPSHRVDAAVGPPQGGGGASARLRPAPRGVRDAAALHRVHGAGRAQDGGRHGRATGGTISPILCPTISIFMVAMSPAQGLLCIKSRSVSSQAISAGKMALNLIISV